MCRSGCIRRDIPLLLCVALLAVTVHSTVEIMAAAIGDDVIDKDEHINDIDEKLAKFSSGERDDDVTNSDNRIPTIVGEDRTHADASDHASVELSQLNRTINRTVVSESPKAGAPKYMLELYNKFSTDKYSHPMANIVRSFTNILPDTRTLNVSVTSSGNWTREHHLVFNVSSVGREEEIYLAELRLLTLVESDRNLYDGINRCVSVYEVNDFDEANEVSSPSHAVKDLIASKTIYGSESGWETFTMTDAVRRWVRSRSIIQMVEVRIETVGSRDDVTSHEYQQQQQPVVDVDTRPHNDNEPLLLVFSNDRRRRKFESRELHEMLDHELDAVDDVAELDTDDVDLEPEYDDEEIDDNGDVEQPDDVDLVEHQMEDYVAHVRVERDTEWLLSHHGVTSLKDIDYGNGSTTGDQVGASVDGASSAVRKRVRRAKKRIQERRTKRNICRRKKMYVNFQDIHWDTWIIKPKGYEAYECTGRCYFPLSDHLTPTKHAIVQTILNTNHPRKASRTCCVPTKLDPISILYIDEQGIVTYKYKYEGMVVAECGCR